MIGNSSQLSVLLSNLILLFYICSCLEYIIMAKSFPLARINTLLWKGNVVRVMREKAFHCFSTEKNEGTEWHLTNRHWTWTVTTVRSFAVFLSTEIFRILEWIVPCYMCPFLITQRYLWKYEECFFIQMLHYSLCNIYRHWKLTIVIKHSFPVELKVEAENGDRILEAKKAHDHNPLAM